MAHDGRVVEQGRIIVDGPAGATDIPQSQGGRGAGALPSSTKCGCVSSAGVKINDKVHRNGMIE